MNTIIRFVLRFLATTVILAVSVTIIFWEGDFSKEQATEKYANDESAFFKDSAGSLVHYRDRGEKSAPVLLFIHGTSASLHTWEPLIAHEKLQDFRLVSLDLPGHGLTGANESNIYTREVFSQAIVDTLDYLDVEKAVLIGNSLGGRIAWQTAVSFPERVESLVLLAPSGANKQGPSSSNIGFKILATNWGQLLMQRLTPRFLIERSLKQTVVDDSIVTPFMVDRYWELLKMQGNRKAMASLASGRRLQTVGFDEFASVRLPVLTIWGAEDTVLPVYMLDQFVQKQPEMEVLKLENIGHLPQEESVDAVANRIFSFLSVNR